MLFRNNLKLKWTSFIDFAFTQIIFEVWQDFTDQKFWDTLWTWHVQNKAPWLFSLTLVKSVIFGLSALHKSQNHLDLFYLIYSHLLSRGFIGVRFNFIPHLENIATSNTHKHMHPRMYPPSTPHTLGRGWSKCVGLSTGAEEGVVICLNSAWILPSFSSL